VEQQRQLMMEPFSNEKNPFFSFLTGSWAHCLIGQMERPKWHESSVPRKRTRFSFVIWTNFESQSKVSNFGTLCQFLDTCPELNDALPGL
jgi:hypothetical protein